LALANGQEVNKKPKLSRFISQHLLFAKAGGVFFYRIGLTLYYEKPILLIGLE
jgi:hypothetical protein